MDEKDITIENKLKEFRKKSSLSQEELADELGISRQSVIALEQGRSMPSLPLAVSMCQFFHAAFEDIFEFEREMDARINEDFNNLLAENENINKKVSIPENGIGKEKRMVELEPWRPLRETVSLRDAIDRLFEDSFITPSKLSTVMPKIDIEDKKDRVIVRAELPGVDEKDINIEIIDNTMTISGERREEKEEKEGDKGYYYKESHTGAFSRTFTLPSDVVEEKATAEMENGVLTVSVPKVAPKQAKRVEVRKK